MQNTPTTLASLIQSRQAELGLNDDTLAAVAGYSSGKVVEMIKRGAMRLPVNKAVAFADALQLDRKHFFSVALNESAPDLMDVIKEIFPSFDLSTAESNLIRHVRELSKGRAGAPIVFDGAGVIALVVVQ